MKSVARRLAPFLCVECGATVGYTAPGEAIRMSKRAHVFCLVCKDKPADLTDRQREMIEQAQAIREAKGEPTSYGEIADAMGLSRSRVQSIAAAIRLRGRNDLLREAIYGPYAEGDLEPEYESV